MPRRLCTKLETAKCCDFGDHDSASFVRDLPLRMEMGSTSSGLCPKVTESTITVTTTDGNSVEVALTPRTTFTKQDKTVSAKEINLGDRVVIHAKKNGEKLEATSVQLGTAKSMSQTNLHGTK